MPHTDVFSPVDRDAGVPRLLLNPRAAAPAEPFPRELDEVLGEEGAQRAWTALTAAPGYRPTPLRALPTLAAGLGVAEVRAKDESDRFGLGSFKALGGAYAVARLAGQWRARGLDPAGLTVCCATAGNHGRSVARGARDAGCACVVFVPGDAAGYRVRRIEAEGAQVVRVPGTYDQAVRHCARLAAEQGWQVVSDTAYDGYTEIPRWVMQGYTVLAEEVVRQWPGEPPTHVFLQCGVGGLAAAVCAHLWRRWGAHRPRCVVVEPAAAACMQASVAAGSPVEIAGELATRMACLACGEVSSEAWRVLCAGADALLTVHDGEAEEAVARLARDDAGDPPIRSAPSGAAGAAGLIVAASARDLRRALQLDEQSRVLLVVSETGAGGAVHAA